MTVGALGMHIAVFVEGQEIGRTTTFSGVGDGVGQGQGLFLEGRGDIEALDTVAATREDEAIEGVFVFWRKGRIDAVEAKVAQPRGVQEGAQTVVDGVADHAGDRRRARWERRFHIRPSP